MGGRPVQVTNLMHPHVHTAVARVVAYKFASMEFGKSIVPYSGEGIIQKLILIFAYCFSGCQSTIQKLPPAHTHGPVQMGVGG